MANVGLTNNRPLCIQTQHEVLKALCKGKKRYRIYFGCISDQLGTGTPGCISILHSHSEHDKTGQSQNDFDYSSLSQIAMVSGPD